MTPSTFFNADFRSLAPFRASLYSPSHARINVEHMRVRGCPPPSPCVSESLQVFLRGQAVRDSLCRDAALQHAPCPGLRQRGTLLCPEVRHRIAANGEEFRRKAGFPKPGGKAPPRTGLSPIVDTDCPVHLQVLIQDGVLRVPGPGAEVHLPYCNHAPRTPCNSAHFLQNFNRSGDVLQHLMRMHYIKRVRGKVQSSAVSFSEIHHCRSTHDLRSRTRFLKHTLRTIHTHNSAFRTHILTKPRRDRSRPAADVKHLVSSLQDFHNMACELLSRAFAVVCRDHRSVAMRVETVGCLHLLAVSGGFPIRRPASSSKSGLTRARLMARRLVPSCRVSLAGNC
mmetsp:Transcript_52908/g.103462  ORF Transcript_52908/g.103462 Transcript_52908/m.103462 type:complete len:339 (-) Transcript_52908:61-1077(-)